MIKVKNKAITWLLPLFTVIAMVIIWQVLAMIINLNIVLPTPILALKEFFNCFIDKGFYLSILLTLFRTIACYFACFILGWILGYISFKNEKFNMAISPIINLLRAVPTMSVILLILLWINYEIAPIVIAFIVVFPISYASSFSGYKSLDLSLFDMAKIYKIEDKTLYKKYVFPTLLDKFSTSSVTELLLTFKIVISGEVMAESAKGLGELIKQSKYSLATGKLFAYTIVAVLLGLLLEYLLKGIINLFKKGGKL